MLAYRLIQELAARWSALDLTVQEGIDLLASLCLVEVQVNGQVPFTQTPQPSEAIQCLLDAARVRLPSALCPLPCPARSTACPPRPSSKTDENKNNFK